MSKKTLFILMILGFLQYAFVRFLILVSFFDEFTSLTLDLISFTSQPAYKITMVMLNFLCGAVLIVLSWKSRHRFPFGIGAIYSGVAWLLFFCISREYRQLNDKSLAIFKLLQLFIVLIIGLNLLLTFSSGIFAYNWVVLLSTVSLIFIRIFFAVSMYKMMKSEYRWLSGIYLILGELGLLLGEIAYVIYINYGKKRQEEMS